MTLSQHLEELRKRFLVCMVALCLGFIAAYTRSEAILGWLAQPAGSLIFLSPAEAFLTRLKIAFFAGAFLAMPVFLFETWQFVVTALKENEKKALAWIFPASFILFVSGASLSVFIVMPAAMHFLLAYGSPQMQPMLSVGAYLEFVFSLTLAFGLLFQLPLILFFLHWAGLVSRGALSSWRRGIYVGAFLAAAVLTPGPDVFSQILLALPIILLYEISLICMRLWRDAPEPISVIK